MGPNALGAPIDLAMLDAGGRAEPGIRPYLSSMRAALLIGVGRYDDHRIPQLRAPVVDVNTLAALLADPTRGAFDDVVPLVDCTEVIARRGLARFYKGRERDDLLLLYLSCHGIRDEHGQLYLACTDSQRDLLSGTALSPAFVRQQMSTSESRRQVVIVDCCFSGAFVRDWKGGPGGEIPPADLFMDHGFGRVILTASSAVQFARDGEVADPGFEHSLFTRFVIEGIRTGDADQNGDMLITATELHGYASRRMNASSEWQTPQLFCEEHEGELVISHVSPESTAESATVRRLSPAARTVLRVTSPVAVLVLCAGLVGTLGSLENDDITLRQALTGFPSIAVMCLMAMLSANLSVPPSTRALPNFLLGLATFVAFNAIWCEDWVDVAPCSTASVVASAVMCSMAIVLYRSISHARSRGIRSAGDIIGPGLLRTVSSHTLAARLLLLSTAGSIATVTLAGSVSRSNDRAAAASYSAVWVLGVLAAVALRQRYLAGIIPRTASARRAALICAALALVLNVFALFLWASRA